MRWTWLNIILQRREARALTQKFVYARERHGGAWPQRQASTAPVQSSPFSVSPPYLRCYCPRSEFPFCSKYQSRRLHQFDSRCFGLPSQLTPISLQARSPVLCIVVLVCNRIRNYDCLKFFIPLNFNSYQVGICGHI